MRLLHWQYRRKILANSDLAIHEFHVVNDECQRSVTNDRTHPLLDLSPQHYVGNLSLCLDDDQIFGETKADSAATWTASTSLS